MKKSNTPKSKNKKELSMKMDKFHFSNDFYSVECV